jgi:hypothetical protein
MLSKCANPVCSETFRYLHQGRIFQLVPTPAMELAAVAKGLLLVERFWLCDACSKEMTVIWDGARAKVVRLPQKPIPTGKTLSPTPGDAPMQDRLAQDGLDEDRLDEDRLAQVRLTQDRPNKQPPRRETLLQTNLPPTRLRAAFAGRRPR